MNDCANDCVINCRQLTAEEVEDIRAIKFKDVLVKTTNIGDDDIQADVFSWNTGKSTVLHIIMTSQDYGIMSKQYRPT